MSRSKDNVTVKFQGIYLLCQGYFEAGEDMTHDYPGSAPEFDIHNVLVDSTDIMDLLDYQQLDELEHLALESFMDN
jgi:hypothetical protein